MNARVSALGLAALLLAGCDASDDDPSTPTVRPDPASPECRADSERVRDAFSRPEGAILFHGVSPAPIASRGRELDTRLPRIIVTEDRIEIDDVVIAGEAPPVALAAELSMRATLAGVADHGGADGHGGGWANEVLLYAPGMTPVSRLRDALAETDPELRFDFVVQHAATGATEEPHPPAWLATELEQLRRQEDLDLRRQRFRELFTRAVGDCAEARAHAPFVFGRDPAVPASAAPSGTVADALRACGCRGVETDALVAIGILTGPPNRHPLRRLTFQRADAPGERVITAIPSDTVAAFVDQLASGRDPLRVYFPPE
ncbi:MAG: hypothetical protein H6719_37150 [Sandaracinaceae bacterium]|nr:hypothetical protein [Sandaracinaceae bacterium]